MSLPFNPYCYVMLVHTNHNCLCVHYAYFYYRVFLPSSLSRFFLIQRYRLTFIQKYLDLIWDNSIIRIFFEISWEILLLRFYMSIFIVLSSHLQCDLSWVKFFLVISSLFPCFHPVLWTSFVFDYTVYI